MNQKGKETAEEAAKVFAVPIYFPDFDPGSHPNGTQMMELVSFPIKWRDLSKAGITLKEGNWSQVEVKETLKLM